MAKHKKHAKAKFDPKKWEADKKKYGSDPVTFGINAYHHVDLSHHDPHCKLWCMFQIPADAEIKDTYMMTGQQEADITNRTFGPSASDGEE